MSSLKMMVAARGASFSRASCPKSSPSCSVVTRPCVQPPRRESSSMTTGKCYSCPNYLSVCDHVYGAFPDDIPRGAFVPLAEHCITKTANSDDSHLHIYE